jgi:uroporphyrinogen-III synthase
MRAIVTRPAAQAAGWVARLRDAGHDAVALPLIAIAPAADPAPVQAAWRSLAARRLAVFVSPNAAAQFLAARPADLAWPAATLAGSTGPGTSLALREQGVPPGCIVEPGADAPQFDSEALWARLRDRDWQGAQVLIVRGDGGREWLAETLRAQGASVALLAAYRRCVPELDARERALLGEALRAPRAHVWLFSSSEAIDNLGALVGLGVDWSQARAVATHARIAARAQQLGLGQVELTRPTLAAVSACIQSMPP